MASTATTQSPLLVPRGALEGKPPIPISRPVWIIGSRKGCHLHLVSEHVSQAHAVIINTGRGLYIKDLASRTHTYVNRLPVKEVLLSDGDKVQIGTFKFYFRDPTANPGDRPPVAPAAVLKVKGERIPVPLDQRVTLIGRRTSADIPLTEESVSTTHALIIDIDGEHYVRDLGSRTGTYLNGQKINRQAPLSAGDVLRIGDTEMTFDTIVEQAPAEEEEPSGESAIAVALSESSAPLEPAPLEPAADAPQAELPAEVPAEGDLALPLSFEELMTPAESGEVTPATPEVSATATPVADEELPLSIAPEPVAETPQEPVVEPPAKGVRRGWRQWGSRQPGQAKAPAPKAEAPPARVEPPVASEAEPLALSEPLELSEIPTSEPAGADLTPTDEPTSPPTIDLSAETADEPQQVDEPAPADEPALPLEPLDADTTDTAYGVEAATSAASEESAADAARDEVTAGELELSAVDESHELDLEASTEESSVATETEPPADEVFKDVDLEALALDALNEPSPPASEPAVEAPAAEEEVSATMDLSAAAEPDAVEPELVPPPSLDLVEPEAPSAPVEEVTPEQELPSKGDEDALKDEPLTMADDGAPASERVQAPAASPAEPTKPEQDLPPPLVTPVRLKPSTRRRKRGGDDEPPPRRRGPIRGPGGKFLSAAEAEKLAREQEASVPGDSASDGLSEVEAPGLSEVEAPAQSATTDIGAEVLEPTEPTPESALSLEPVTPPVSDTIPLPAEEPPPSDSVFGRTVEELAGGAGTGDLIDDPSSRPMSPLEQIAADATHFVETDAHHDVEVEHPAEPPEILEHEADPGDEIAAADEVAAGELEMSEPAEAHALDLTSEAPLELPAIDEEPPPADAAAVEPELPLELPAIGEEPVAEHVPEPVDELDLSSTSELPLETEPPAAGEPEPPPELSFDETFEPTEATSLAGDAAPAEPSATVSETTEPEPLPPPQRPQPPTGPAGLGFFGIVRDADTFLGGMPLSLPPLPPPPSTFGKVGVAFGQGEKGNPHAAPPPPPLVIGADDDEPVAEAPGLSNEQTATGMPLDDGGGNDTTIITPAADTGAITGPAGPRMPVPPRPRRNRLADYEKRFAKVDEDAALEAMLREQNKGQPEPSATATGFDGLTLGTAVRQTDVFSDAPSAPIPASESSNDPFLADKQASIDLAARTVETGRIPPPAGAAPAGATPPNGSDVFGPPAIPTAAIAERPPARAIGERGRPPRQSLPAPSPDFNYTGPRRGPRWISIRVLVAAMVVFMVAAGVAGFMLTPVYTTLLAKVSFANLKERTEFEKHKFRTEQQTVLTSEVVRNQARAKLAEQAPALQPGLLADPMAFDQLARNLEWPAGTNDMRLELKSVDPAGDRQRLAALLDALYSENKHLLDVAAEKRSEFDKAQQELDALNAQLKALIIRIREANDSLSDAPSPSLIAQVEQEAGQLADAWQAAVAKVRQLKFDLEKLAPAGMEPGAAQPVEAAVGEAVGGDPDKDPVVVAAREELKALQADIARLKALSAEDAADKARKALEESVATYQAELARLQDGKGADWQDFLAKAKKLQGMALQMTGDLINRQREVQEKLAEMKSKLEQELVEQRARIYAEDPKLKELNDKFRLATRQYNVASAEPSLAAEAARWKEDVERQQAAIAQRKAELPDDPEVVKRIAEVQRLIEEGQRSITSDRRTLDVQMADTLKEFLGSGGALYKKLDDADKAAAQSLADRASVMVGAHETYGKVVNSIKSGDSDELRKKEAAAQQLSATIDHRIAEIKDAEGKKKGELERQAAQQQIEEARTALAVAEKDELAARDKWLAKQKELAELKNKALIAKAADDKLQENQRARQAMETQISAKVRELDEKRKTGVATITPEAVAPDAITTGPTEDGRWKYALVSSMAVCGVFLVLIWLGGYHQTPTSGGGPRPAIESVGAPKDSGEDTVAV